MLITTGLFILCELFAFGVVWKTYQEAQAAEAWPSVPGIVLSSSNSTAKKKGKKLLVTNHEFRIRYKYEVGKKSYTSKRYTMSVTSSEDRSAIEKLVTRYKKGTRVTVFYNPQQPDKAVLVKGEARKLFIFLCALVVSVLATLGALLMFGLGMHLTSQTTPSASEES